MKWLDRIILAVIGALALAAIGLAIGQHAHAATTPNSFVTAQTPNIGVQTFVAGTDTAGTFKTVYTGATNGSKCFALMENNNDASATHLLTVRVVHSATNVPIATFTTALGGASQAYGATANLMASANWAGLPIDSAGNPYVLLANGDTLQVTFATALTALDQINVIAVCADF